MEALERYLPACRIFLLDGKKFRTNLLVLFFDLPLKRETATKTALLAEVLKKTDWQTAARQAEELYGALWDIAIVKKGKRQLLLFSLETLKAVDVEDAIGFLQERLFSPLREGVFREEIVERQKAILKQRLEAMQDDKKDYASRRALEETAKGTDWAVSADGYKADLEEINAGSLFSWYREICERAAVKIFFCGDKTEKEKIVSLRKAFAGKVVLAKEEEEADTVDAPQFIRERMEMEQARLVLGFQADVETERRQAALLLCNRLLGGDADSLLFQKVREEAGLCYDVKSFCYPLSPFFFVQAGIRAQDAKETGKLVLKAIAQLKEEGVSAEKLRQAKDALLREYDALADTPWAMVDFFAEQALQGRELRTEKLLRCIEQTEMEEIRRAAAHLQLKTVYLLSGEEANHADAGK